MWNHKIPRGKHRGEKKLPDIGIGNGFFRYDAKNTGKKSKE